VKRKKIALLSAIILLIVIIPLSVGLLTTYVQIPSSGVINSSPPVPVSATYAIRQSGQTIMAINSAGETAFSSTSATTTIQWALDQVGPIAVDEASRKKIFVEDGVYNLEDSPTRGISGSQSDEPGAIWFAFPGKNQGGYSYITFEGESTYGTIFKTNNGPYNAFYLYGKSIEHGDGEDKPNKGLVFRNFTIDGGASAEYPKWNVQNAIQTRATHNSLFEGLYVTNMGRTAFYNTEHSQGNEWRYNIAFHNYRYGLSYTSSHSGYVHHNVIEESQAWGVNWDATFAKADNCLFEYNTYRNNKNCDIAMFSEAGAAPLQHGEFRYETIDSTLDRSSVYIMWVAQDLKFHHNTINHAGSGPAVKFDQNLKSVDFYNNVITATNTGIVLWAGDGAIIQNNEINAKLGIDIGDAANTKIVGNTFVGTNGVEIRGGVTNTVIGQLTGQPISDRNNFSQVTGTTISDGGVNTQIGTND
jgi:hypothetical protein